MVTPLNDMYNKERNYRKILSNPRPVRVSTRDRGSGTRSREYSGPSYVFYLRNAFLTIQYMLLCVYSRVCNFSITVNHFFVLRSSINLVVFMNLIKLKTPLYYDRSFFSLFTWTVCTPFILPS